MNRRSVRRPLAAAIPLALAAALTTTAAAQETTAHVILSVQRDARGGVMGYRIHHETHKKTYVALLAPDDVGSPRCSYRADERLTITEGDGPTAYFEGRDGEPCRLSVFRPEPGTPTPWDVPPSGVTLHPCPTCPGP